MEMLVILNRLFCPSTFNFLLLVLYLKKGRIKEGGPNPAGE